MASTWFCRCGKINLASNNKCQSCGGYRWNTEKKKDSGAKGGQGEGK